jgi:hypothetical protein
MTAGFFFVADFTVEAERLHWGKASNKRHHFSSFRVMSFRFHVRLRRKRQAK